MKLLTFCALASIVAVQPARAADWPAVDAALGRSGTEQPGGVHRYSFSRSDLNVNLDGVRLKPGLALGSWLAFQPHGNEAILMGDLVLLHEEINPVLSRLLEGGLTISALHNHLLRSRPGTMYMHVHGHGDPARMAATVRAALALTRTPLATTAATPPATERFGLDVAAIDGALGANGKVNGGVLQYSILRKERITDGGAEVPPSMGLGTVINLQPTQQGRAVATGDFVLTSAEVTPVLRVLRNNGIEVTALHNHLAQEQPRLFFLHFWGNAEAGRLATGLRQALDRTNVTSTRPAAATGATRGAL